MTCLRAAPLWLALLSLLGGCRTGLWDGLRGAGRGGDWVAVETASGEVVTLDQMARTLADCDVVFLGERHDSDTGHRLQFELTERILALRPNLSLTFEMIERDAQPALDRYLAGEIDEATFLGDTRHWPNYRSHYRPMVLLAKEHHLPVIAANVPRPLASRVSKQGLGSVAGELHMPREVIAPPGEYKRRFAAAMGKPEDSDEPGLALWFLAQCVKDEAMAESIERALCAAPAPRMVVHYCGYFHSDFGLGTVERLLRRQPALNVGIVTMREYEGHSGSVDAELARAAEFVWRVR